MNRYYLIVSTGIIVLQALVMGANIHVPGDQATIQAGINPD